MGKKSCGKTLSFLPIGTWHTERLELYNVIDAKSPALGWTIQLLNSVYSSPTKEGKSPAELGLANFVVHGS